MLPPGSIQPADTLIDPITQGLISVAQQIVGIGPCYPRAPEAPPEDGAVLFPVTGIKVDEQYYGRATLTLSYEMLHLFRRTRLQDTLLRLYPFVPAWISAIAAEPNVTLDGLVQGIEMKKIELQPYRWGEQLYLALVSTVEVTTLYTLLTN
jgi:hypothetical protein